MENMAPRPPRIQGPTAPAPRGRAPKAPRLKLSTLRAQESVAIDGGRLRDRGREEVEIPPYVYWKDFRLAFSRWWEAGDHIALTGMTKSGKTTLMRNILSIRDFVVVFGTKPRDSSLYEPLLKQGFVLTDKFDAENTDNPKIIFRPPLGDLSKDGRAAQKAAFGKALNDIYRVGGWCVAMDEVRYLTEQLRLIEELNLLWLQGRSLDVSIVAATQRPVSVPLNMYEQATHYFNWNIAGRDDRARASEYLGILSDTSFSTMAVLPDKEFLYVDKIKKLALRSKVDL